MSSVPARHAIFARAKYLAGAGAVEYGVQLLVPMFLVRTLSHEDFASYRFMWLLAGTLTGSLLLGFPASLYYFIPRAAADRQFGYVAQTGWFCALLAALACAVLYGVELAWPGLAFVPLMPRPLPTFFAFLVLIGATGMLDYLPAARSDVKAQAGLNLAVALLRAACTVAGAWFGSITAVCWALAAYAAGRFLLMCGYVARRMPVADEPAFDLARFKGQFAYAVPFGVASAFWSLRTQAEGWVGASILSPHEYALVSIAGSITPILMLVHQAVTASSVSAVNRLEAQGDVPGMVGINADANVISTSYLFPVLTFFFVVSTPLFTLVYTPAYAEAAMVTKLLCVSHIATTIEMTTLTKALRLRRRTLNFEAVTLVASVAVSTIAGLHFGFIGVVFGSVLARWVSAAYYLRVLTRRTQVPLARFQHWSELARYLFCSVAAGCVGWIALQASAQQSLLLQILIATAALCIAYVPLALAFGLHLPRRRVLFGRD